MNLNIPYEIRKLENEPITTTNQNHEYDDYENIYFDYISEYLYHGIRFQTYLERLESIFKERKILAGKHLPDYRYYDDNCNKGEYVSSLKLLGDNKFEYEAFILETNVSVLISPLCNAIETKYVSYGTWFEIQSKKYELKHLYSYMRGECMCKDFIPIDFVKAIGVPYQRLVFYDKQEFADKLIEDIQSLMKQYNIELPIVDTSRYNRVLVGNVETTKKRKISIQSKMRKKFMSGGSDFLRTINEDKKS